MDSPGGPKASFGFVAEVEDGVSRGHFNYVGGLHINGDVALVYFVNAATHTNLPFTVAVTTNAEGQGRLGLLIGTTSLPGAIVNEGEHDDPVVLSLPPDLVTPAYLGRRCAGP
jgi:hypothetical protein